MMLPQLLQSCNFLYILLILFLLLKLGMHYVMYFLAPYLLVIRVNKVHVIVNGSKAHKRTQHVLVIDINFLMCHLL